MTNRRSEFNQSRRNGGLATPQAFAGLLRAVSRLILVDAPRFTFVIFVRV
ncbi:MAG: hypothetical protein P8K08_00485 [Fuerstiella sp.]|nr:hypothetical protein [Fuerstiella sp.]